MPKKELEEVVSETGNWNVASEYAKLKIMRPLFLADEYAAVAKFGSGTLIDDLTNFGLDIPIDTIRMKALARLVDVLITLIDNTVFAIKNANDIKTLTDHKNRLKKIESLLPNLSQIITSQRTKSRIEKIKEIDFSKILKIVTDIKAKINEPLNKNHLIFTDREEFDPVEYKKRVIHEATTRG